MGWLAGFACVGAHRTPSDELLDLLDEADKEADFDEDAVRVLLLTFERAASTNQTQRAQFPDDPQRWMDSEVALDEALKALHVLGSCETWL